MKKYILWTAVLLGTLVLSACTSSTTNPPVTSWNAAAADMTDTKAILWKCLADKWAIFYGTERCPHCTNQKSKFWENAMNVVPYIDCDKNSQTCNRAGIQWYPTRIFADWSKVEWAQELSTLAQKAWCEYNW